MRVFIVGAGAVGSVLAELLAKRYGKRNVACGDRDPVRARLFAAPGGVRPVKVDASRPADVARAAAGADLIVNAGLPDFNERVMEAALLAGAHYQDLCSKLADLRHCEQLRHDARFRRAGRTALFNTGAAPGLTNVMAAELAAGLDRTRAVRIRLLEEQDAEEPVMSWSPRVIVDELASPPLVYRGGKFGNVRAFSGAETFAFPRPFGPRRVVAVYGDEVATLPSHLDVRDVDMKSGGTDIDLGAALAAAGLLGDVPVRVGREKARPRDLLEIVAPKVPTPAEMTRLVRKGSVRNSWLVAAVEAEGTSRRRAATRSMAAVFPDLLEVMRRRPGATYVSYPTALCAAAMCAVVPRVGRPGALPPEALPAGLRREVLRDVARAGVRFVRRSKAGGTEKPKARR